SGTRLKIYEAMAMGRPVVSTAVGAEGLPVRDGEHLLIADDPEDFATAVVRLLEEPQLGAGMGKAARELVRRQFGWDCAADEFARICERAVARSRERAGVKPCVPVGVRAHAA